MTSPGSDLSEFDCETLGRLVDRLDNATYATKIPLPPKMHADALTEIVGEVRDELKAWLQSKGFNPWT